MKKLLIFLTLATSNFSLAQSNPLIGPFFETSFFTVKSKVFDAYTDNFSSIYQADLKSGFTKFSPKSAFSWGIESSVFGFNVSAKFNTFKSESNAVFNNGDSRVFELKQKMWSVPVGAGILISDGGPGVDFGATIAFGVQTTELSSVYVYSDGTRSTGFDKSLNGVYSSIGGIFVPEILIGYGRFIYVYTSVSYQFSFSNMALKDENKFELDKEPAYFPAQTDKGNGPNFGGLRINFGLKFNFADFAL